MKSSSCRSLEVFDFKEEDELSELASSRYMGRFKNTNPENSPIMKYKFLESVAQGTNVQSKEIGNVLFLDVDTIDIDHSCDNGISYTSLRTAGEDCATKEGTSGLDAVSQFNSTSHEQHPHFKPDNLEPGSLFPGLGTRASSSGASSPGNSQLNCALPESPSTNEPVDVISNADKSMKESSPLTPASDTAEDGGSLDGRASDNCFGGWELDDINMAVVVCPDYIVYRDKYCTESLLTFSSSCMKIKGSTAYGNQGTFSFQWGIDDIIDVESQWHGRVETAMVKLRVIAKDALRGENAHDTSGIEELKFAVVDPKWLEKQEEITSLDVRYKAVWNVVLDTDMGRDRDALLGQNSVFFPNCYFPNFDEHFEDVVYPKGDCDAVSISKRDVDLLLPDTFINDTIIDFYIKYLKNKIHREENHRFHFFNSFFFRKLADLDKDPSSAFEGRAAFQRVRKWTRKVNLFEKDYIFIPVNFNLHWSLVVICHPGEVANFKDEDIDKSLKVPCILHMDSIKGTHTGLKNLVQSYLWEEWKERQKETSEDISLKFFNLRFVPLELPQQENSFDCGLFLLHYAELFLAEAPVNFSPFKITKYSNFLNVDWFPPAEASLKRALIQRLIYELLENRSPSPAACSGEGHFSKVSEKNNENEIGVEFLSERCSPAKACHGNLSSSGADRGIEITLLATSSLRSSQFVNDSGLVLREFFEPGATAGSFLDAQYQPFDQTTSFHRLKGVMSPIEEDPEAGEHFVYSPSGETDFRQLADITSEACSIPYSSRNFRAETSWKPGISVQQAEHEDVDSSPETSICASDDSLEVEINENSQVREDVGPSHKEKIDQPRSPPVENVECLTESLASASSEMLETSVEDSEDPDKMHDSNDNEDLLPSHLENPLGSFHQDSDMEENGDGECDDVQLIGDDLVPQSDVQQAAKRPRLTPPLEGERRLTRSLSKDLHL